MYFKFSLRRHPQSEKLSGYYLLVESYRNADNRVCHRTILNVGFMEDVTAEQLNKIQKQLTERYEHRQSVFQRQDDPSVNKNIEELWQRIVASKKLDLVPAEKLSRMVNMDTLQHSNAREVGAENIAYQTWEKLQLGRNQIFGPLVRKNKARGMEIVALAFESKPDFEYASTRVKKSKEKLNANYTFLIAGESNKEKAGEVLPMLSAVVAFPTHIYIDKKGEIRKIHTGFNGPATGGLYDRWVAEHEALVREMLAES